MLFNSVQFILFFIAVTIIYFLIGHKYRRFFLLLASCIFYVSLVPWYLIVLFAMITVDYAAGIWIEKSRGRQRAFFLVLSIAANCSLLFFFKYFNFINESLVQLADFLGWNYSYTALSIIIPIGLSFHTFQSLSYVIEVYKGKQKAERNYGIYALYVMFFPQLVAGPIERPQHLLPQFRAFKPFDFSVFKSGLLLMLWGFFKKLVIADRLALVIKPVFLNPALYNGMDAFAATIFFGIQIYADFSGYTDIARGSARVLGFSLVENFRQPYAAKSVAEFWRRWHISLSSWFRDYIYIPLGGSRLSVPRWAIAILIVFIVSGLWHGADWRFVLWGLLHGTYILFSRLTADIRLAAAKLLHLHKIPAVHAAIKIAITFILVNLAWIFFRVDTMSKAEYMLNKIGNYFISSYNPIYMMLYIIFALSPVFYFMYLYRKGIFNTWLSGRPIMERVAVYAIMGITTLVGLYYVNLDMKSNIAFLGITLLGWYTNLFSEAKLLFRLFGYYCVTIPILLFSGLLQQYLGNELLTANILVALFAFVTIEFLQTIQNASDTPLLSQRPTAMRWTAYIFLILAIILLGIFEPQQFIYVRF